MSNKRKSEGGSAEEINHQPVLKKFKPSQSLGCDDPECSHEDNCPNVVLVGCPSQHSICANCLKRRFEDGASWEGWNLLVEVECPACAEEQQDQVFKIRTLEQHVSQVPTRTLKPFDDKCLYKCGFHDCNKMGTLSELNQHILDPRQCSGWKLQCERCKGWLNLLTNEHLEHGSVCTKQKLDQSLGEFKQAVENFNMDVFDGHEHCAKDFRMHMPNILQSMATKLKECKEPKVLINLMRSMADAMQCSDNDHFTAASKFVSAEVCPVVHAIVMTQMQRLQAKQELGIADLPFGNMFNFEHAPPGSPTKQQQQGGGKFILTQTTMVVKNA